MDPTKYTDLNISPRIMLGPGPSMVDARVLRAMATPVVGHLDPDFIKVMDDTQELLRYVFQTKNEITIPISGTGTSGMETALCNFIEPGDNVLVAVSGYFGERLVDMASRYGAEVDRIDQPWGEAFDPAEVEEALGKKQYKLIAIVHGETSTGVCQKDIKAIADAAHKHGVLLLLDTVASLGGTPVEVDAWGVDICYSGSQKALSAPPGLALITVSPLAAEVFKKRKTKVPVFYFDLNLLMDYWGSPKKYHHTAPVTMIMAMREAMRLVAEEGLEARFKRHRGVAEQLWEGLANLYLPLLVPPANRLVTLTTPQLPDGLDELAIRKALLNEYNIEVAGGFGPLAGKVWRIGLMGFSARKENVTLLLAALGELLS
jgi:alanine-glyoxylate transaminase/serine-glyoxylate transaminase/serine-pyruvate transaminase